MRLSADDAGRWDSVLERRSGQTAAMLSASEEISPDAPADDALTRLPLKQFATIWKI
jgi:hypothetical protein